MNDLAALTWPLTRLNEALVALADRGCLSPQQETLPAPAAYPATDAAGLGRWVETAVSHLGIEAQPVTIAYADLASFLHTAGPAILQLPESNPPQFMALVAGQKRKLTLLGPDLTIHQLPLETVRAALCWSLEAPILPEIDQLLSTVGTPQRQQARARTAILQERLAQTRVGNCWLLDHSPGSSFWRQLRRAGVLRYFLSFITTFTVQQLLYVLSWWVIGRTVFQGRLEMGWLLAWALLLITLIPLRMVGSWLQGVTAVTIGGLLQKRLLYGALRLEPDEIRHMGAGQLMGRIFEAESVESLSLTGGVRGLTALIELIIAVWILSVGAGGLWHAGLLLAWLCLTGIFVYRFYQRRSNWTHVRRHLTHELIEGMVGHRTRLMQTAPHQWHEGEDEALTDYIGVSGATDRVSAQLEIVVSRGWMVVGLVGLLPAFIAGSTNPAALAISLGGILSAHQALVKLMGGLINQLLAAVIAWEQVAPIFKAATRTELLGMPDAILSTAVGQRSEMVPLLNVHNLTYRYRNQGDLILDRCDLRVQSGSRTLLVGPSGSGKSTLAAVLTGLRHPNSGLLLWQGYDRLTIGDSGWRQRVVFAPQFHDNYVLGSTFLFNLLMGKRWPPHPEDVQLAQTVCEELGLGNVLAQMPAGMLQTVGETGWQLSHGERSRLFIARALLQGADLIILDESFAALDSQSLQQAMQCVQKRAATLIVIAHP